MWRRARAPFPQGKAAFTRGALYVIAENFLAAGTAQPIRYQMATLDKELTIDVQQYILIAVSHKWYAGGNVSYDSL